MVTTTFSNFPALEGGAALSKCELIDPSSFAFLDLSDCSESEGKAFIEWVNLLRMRTRPEDRKFSIEVLYQADGDDFKAQHSVRPRGFEVPIRLALPKIRILNQHFPTSDTYPHDNITAADTLSILVVDALGNVSVFRDREDFDSMYEVVPVKKSARTDRR